MHLGEGDFFLAPRGVPHTYRVGDAPPAGWSRTPTGFADFVASVSELAVPDPERLSEVAAEHDIEILGPPGTMP